MIIDKRTYPGKRLAGLVLTLLCLAVFSSAEMRAQATGISSSPAMTKARRFLLPAGCPSVVSEAA